MKIEWKDVKGSRGYIIRLKQSDNSIEERDTNINYIDLKLNPGDYEIQVAGKNAFGKPGKFSKWKSFTIRDEQKSGVLNLSSNQPVQYKLEEPVKKYSLLEKVIPGYIQYKNDLIIEPILYWTFIPAILYIGTNEKLRGDAIAKDPWNDPVKLYFALNDRSIFEKFYFQQRRNIEKKKYNQAQNLQRYAATGIAFFYLSHILDSFLFDGKGVFRILTEVNNDSRLTENYPSEMIYGVQFNFNVEL
ncbi:MAG: hypothetical protein JJT78_12570 [Leptospira sp.]|nr:hypothetical protein [Leptospira sp.]